MTDTNTPAVELMQRYKSLADIELGFRALNSDIEIDPVYHRLAKRIYSHALACFMAHCQQIQVQHRSVAATAFEQ